MKASKFGLAPAARLRRVSDKISRCSDGETHLAFSTQVHRDQNCLRMHESRKTGDSRRIQSQTSNPDAQSSFRPLTPLWNFGEVAS